MEFVKKLTIPSQSYAKTICKIVGWRQDGSIRRPLAKIAGIAHITGGGIWGKFKEILPKGIGAILDNMPIPAEVLLQAQQLSWDTKLRLTDYQAHGTFHGGCGMMIIAEDKNSAEKIIQEASNDNIKAYIIGHTIKSPNQEIIIHSRFAEEKVLSSEKPE